MSAPRRQGRPELTDDDIQALARLTRDRDGKMLLDRLERIKRHKQDMAHNIREYADQMQHQGAIAELIDLQREFEDAVKAINEKPVAVDRQGRFG